MSTDNYDTKKVVDDYESRDIPLDVFVIDMDWHTKDNWSGFTFDPHLFRKYTRHPPVACGVWAFSDGLLMIAAFPEDDMGYLNAKGLFATTHSNLTSLVVSRPVLRDCL